MISLKDVSKSYDFYTGVPDSRLKPFIKEIEDSPFKHIPSLNEGQAIELFSIEQIDILPITPYLKNIYKIDQRLFLKPN